ncbi:MAG: RHS repeat-associated core domain-containing protein, partial [Rhodoferax sp.]
TRPGSSISYTYDKNSNRLSGTEATTSDTDLDGDFDAADLQRTTAQTPVIANDSNRLLGWSQINTTQRLNAKGQPITSSTSTQVSYGLDAAGNLTSDGLRTFAYDASNRLSQVQVGDDDEASKVTYLHNAAGQRVFKSEPQVAQTAPSEEQLGTDFITWLKKNFGWLFAQAQQNATLGQSYVYADSNLGSYNLLGEYGNGGTKSAGRMEYIYLPTETGTAQLIGLYKNNRFYAVHTDHLGTPRSITDDANKVVWQWAYSAFGDNKPTGILKATTNPKAAITNQPKFLQATSPSFAVNLRFPGQYWDDESKLSYNTYRSYRPMMGDYPQMDPIGLAGGWNRRGYVGANPLGAIDPLGLQALPFPPPPIPGVPNPSVDAQRNLIDRFSRSFKSDDETTYQTYTRYNPLTGDCYSGRTSGTDTPENNVRNRGYGQPLLNAEGFLPPVLDRSSSNKDAIRGREQQLIDLNGGARSSGGDSRNVINGISPFNLRGPFVYIPAATAEFGVPVPAGRCTCQ